MSELFMERDIKLIKKKHFPLNLKMLFVIVVSLVISGLVFVLGGMFITYAINKYYLSPSAVNKRILGNVEDFAAYVNENKVSSSDMNSILKWQRQEAGVYILVYQNKDIIFDSTWWESKSTINKVVDAITAKDTGRQILEADNDKRDVIDNIKSSREQMSDVKFLFNIIQKDTSTEITAEVSESDSTEASESDSTEAPESDSTEALESDSTEAPEKAVTEQTVSYEGTEYVLESENSDIVVYSAVDSGNDAESKMAREEYTFFPIKFSDGIYEVCIVNYSERGLYIKSYILLFVFCCILFIAILLLYNNRIIRRVGKLTEEVSNIEGDDLNAEITKTGSDEIFELSDSVDNMRNRLIDQLGKEKRAWKANQDLVTSMAHDIRTPLTVLSGYLSLLSDESYESKEEMDQYLDICMDKAVKLQELSDKLFKYFYVYSEGKDSITLEKYRVNELFDQMIGEHIVLLSDEGFQFQTIKLSSDEWIETDADYLKRLIDNIFSNIRKYADKDKLITISEKKTNDKICLEVANYISPSRNEAESTKIGIKTCEKICRELGGLLTVEEKDKIYRIYIYLPVA